MRHLLQTLLLIGCATATLFAQAPQTLTVQNVKVQGSLDLDNGVPIRWKKPDGTGYVTIFTLNKDGTLQLCHDPFFWEVPRTKSPPGMGKEFEDLEHKAQRTIEVRNPNTKYPDLRLPITRNRPGEARIWDNDSKLQVRSMNVQETNDPPEINFLRVGNDEQPVNDESAPIKPGSVTGLVRWSGWLPRKDEPGSRPTAAQGVVVFGRVFGTSQENHYGALLMDVHDTRFPEQKGPMMVIMHPGVRIGHDAEKMSCTTGAMLEVDSHDDRPVVFRREAASTTQPVMVALAAGKNGTPADAHNSLAVIKAAPVGTEAMTSRVEFQTNEGNRLQSQWVLPVPTVKVFSNAAQQVPSGELVTLAFGQSVCDTDSMRDAEHPTRLVCRTPGRYVVTAALEFSANGKGSRQMIVRHNGREQVAATRVAAVEGETTQITCTTPPIELKPGDYVELQVRQTSGQALEIPVDGEQPATFALSRVG
jgi:hypothetical protein